MEKSKVAVRYFSKSGNTKKLADEIAKTVGCKAEQIKDKIRRQLVSYQNTLDEMGDFLISWLLSHKSLI